MSPPSMPPTPVLQTPRLVLRPVRSKDGAGHPAPLPAMGGRALAQRQYPLAVSGRRRRKLRRHCLGEMARGEKSHWAIVPKERAGRPDRHHRPVARRRREPRPARLLARSRVPGPRADDRGRRPGDRIMPSSARLACLWLSNAQENLASRRIKEKQGAQLVAS